MTLEILGVVAWSKWPLRSAVDDSKPLWEVELEEVVEEGEIVPDEEELLLLS